MPEPRVQIDNLHIRVPGEDRGVGERLATGLRESLASVPTDRSREYGALRLRVHVAHGASEADTLRAVQRALRQALHQE